MTERRAGALPLVVYVLAAGAFLMGTTAFVIAGLLPEISADLNVSVARAGLLVSFFAVGVAVGAPVVAVLTLRLPRRSTLVLAMLVFAVGHVVAALGDSFTVVAAARLLTAMATGAFWATAAVLAAEAAGPQASARAIGVVVSGLTVAIVVGVPAGSWAGHLSGWRGPFWALAVLAVVGSVAVARLVPADTARASASLRDELGALRNRQLWLVLAATALVQAGIEGAYAYVSPLLTDEAGLSQGLVPLALIGFGAGASAGTTIGGRLGDQRAHATAVVAATLTSATLLMLALAASGSFAAVALIACVGAVGFALSPVLVAMALHYAGPASTIASSLTITAFNAGIAAGVAFAGLSLSTGLGLRGPSSVGAVLTGLALIPLAALRIRPGVRCRTAQFALGGEAS
ncbi:MAG: MFS transporter [Thermoleophilaceae bacterium]